MMTHTEDNIDAGQVTCTSKRNTLIKISMTQSEISTMSNSIFMNHNKILTFMQFYY